MEKDKTKNSFDQHQLPEPIPEEDFVSSPNVIATQKTMIIKNKFFMNDTEFNLQNGFRVKRRSIRGTGNTFFLDDYYVGVTALAVAPTVTLPKSSIAGIGKLYVIKDESGGAGSTTITIQPASGENIELMASTTIAVNFGTMRFITDGANWFTI